VNIAIGIGICNTKFNEYSDQYWYLQYKLDDNSYDWYQQYKYSHWYWYLQYKFNANCTCI